MINPSHRLACVLFLAGGLAQAGCATSIRVHSYAEEGAAIRQYRTYAFGPANLSATGDPRLDDNPFFSERVQMNVDRQLAEHGLEKGSLATSDVIVHYHASVNQQIELNDRPRPECVNGVTQGQPVTASNTPPLASCRPYLYDAGTLLIDLVDRKTNKVVWRGWAEGSVDGVLESQEFMERRVDEAVTKIMAQLPSR